MIAEIANSEKGPNPPIMSEFKRAVSERQRGAREKTMSSERVTLPLGQNRYELCHRAFKAIRRMHRPGNRIQDTTNDVLRRLREERLPEPVEPRDVQEAPIPGLKVEEVA
jgi:hypothetical protein